MSAIQPNMVTKKKCLFVTTVGIYLLDCGRILIRESQLSIDAEFEKIDSKRVKKITPQFYWLVKAKKRPVF